MRRKTVALLLALTMCLSLLSACGADSKSDGEPSTAGNTSSPAEQQPDEKEEQPAQQPEEAEEPAQKPEESEASTPEPEQTEPTTENNAGTEFLALLQEEWQNGFYEGEGPRHTYFNFRNVHIAIHNGVVYIDNTGLADSWYSYNIATKELNKLESPRWPNNFIDNCFYELEVSKIVKRDCNGAELKSFESGSVAYYPFEEGILVAAYEKPSPLLSYDLEKIAEIPVPQRKIEHGLKEDMNVSKFSFFCADGTIYLYQGTSPIYRLNTDTCEWEVAELPEIDGYAGRNPTVPFCGKYVIYHDSIYNWLTGEVVFDWEEAGVYPPVSTNQYRDHFLCYFGGDQYLGYNGSEFRWVNLKDLSMSDPLTFPNSVSDAITVLNDTYCVYYDEYGWFLWNYNTGAEETIMTFDN